MAIYAPEDYMSDRDSARAAKGQLVLLLRGAEHVGGVGLTRQGQDWQVKVNLTEDSATARQSIPEQVLGVEVVVMVVGAATARPI
jgi:hypothetical protein